MNDNTPLPLGQVPRAECAVPGEPTPANVLEEITRIAAERKCINPNHKLIFDSRGRVVNRIYNVFS